MAGKQKIVVETVVQLFERTVEQHRTGQLEAAEEGYRKYLANRPTHSQAWTNLGALMRKTGRLGAAIACHTRSLELKPGDVSARNNLANALADDGQFEASLALREQLLAEDPKNPERLRNLTSTLRGIGRHEEVIALIDKAEAEGWTDGECILQRGLSRLMLGRYEGGFRDFENRYAGDEVSLPEDAPWPRWQGEPIAGKRLLVLPEQGFGDAMLMARFLPGLAKMGAEADLVVKPPLTRLFAELEGPARLIESARKSDSYDFYTPNMSLPHLVGFAEDGLPPPPPRLTIPADSRERAERVVRPFHDRFKIGVVWTGSLTYKANHRRSCGPEHFTDLAVVPGVQLFSLYKGEAHAEFLSSGLAGLIVDACGADRDFADTAALIEQMDLMITTDTAVVHLAASLGKPIWNMLSAEGFWLYGPTEETTPWYSSMRLFRQNAQGDWPELFGRVEAALRAHLEAQP